MRGLALMIALALPGAGWADSVHVAGGPVVPLGLVHGDAPAPAPESGVERFGTVMKYALPAAAALCAHRDDRLEDFALRGILQAGLVLGLKSLTDGRPIGRRPNGGGRGFPSGHAAAAGFGAADLAGKCWPDDPAAGAAVHGAAAVTALSRIGAEQHDGRQVAAGMLIGLGFGAASFGIGGQGVDFALGLRF
ncbi:phosphatase PAP2 family protein [Paracoccus bogoriensis]|uniref:phosphatase PAP2 family protein n=1 Tax=Paracoccus bogoriensis TaxID=242065 RepID=UPI001FE3A116|nr:phosphatase PAP2 family protein [Paracoccus bogoriensis]